MGMHPVQVIAVTGGKGGVGKTNVSVNLALALADLGRRVMLMDADLGLANVDVLLASAPSAPWKTLSAVNVNCVMCCCRGRAASASCRLLQAFRAWCSCHRCSMLG